MTHTRYTVDTLAMHFPSLAQTDIDPLIRQHKGWWVDQGMNGIVAFNDEIDAVNFETALAAMATPETPKKASSAPTNLQSLTLIESAVLRAKHAKRAKEYLTPVTKTKVIEHARLKLDWGSDSNHEAAMVYLKEAFEEYLPAIFDVAVKKAEEADRASRDVLLYWGPKA